MFPILEHRMFRDADLFIANTPSMKQQYEQKYDFLHGRTVLLTNGFDEEDFDECINAGPGERFALLYIGRFFEVMERFPDVILRYGTDPDGNPLHHFRGE